MYFQNVGGLRTKIQELACVILENEYDIYIFTETNLHGDIDSSEFVDSSYVVFRHDRCLLSTGKRSGGVLIMTKKSLNCSDLSLHHNSGDVDQIAVKITILNFSLTLVNSYIPPNSEESLYQKHIVNIQMIADMLLDDDFLLVTGDFNLPNILWNWCDEDQQLYPSQLTTSVEQLVIFSLLSLNLSQVNSHSNHLNRILDLIFTSNEYSSNIFRTEPLLYCDMHHNAMEIVFDLFSFSKCSVTHSNVNSVAYFSNFKAADYNVINNFLINVNFDNVLCNNSLSDGARGFVDILKEAVAIHVPQAKSMGNNHPPWFNPSLIRLRNAKNKAYKCQLKHNSSIYIENFVRLRKEFKFLHRFLYKNYIFSVESELKSNSRVFWSFISKKRSCNNIPDRMHLGVASSGSLKETCELFANYFESVFTTPSKDYGRGYDHLTELLDLGNLVIEEDEVLCKLKSLDNSTSSGPDGLPNIFLKNCASSLYKPLCFLFNLSLTSGTFPDAWKSSFLTPIYKQGARNVISNYRLIAKLSVIPKVFEAIINEKLKFYIKEIIPLSQHGFVQGRSTTTNLVCFTNYVVNFLESGYVVDVITLTFLRHLIRFPIFY